MLLIVLQEKHGRKGGIAATKWCPGEGEEVSIPEWPKPSSRQRERVSDLSGRGGVAIQ